MKNVLNKTLALLMIFSLVAPAMATPKNENIKKLQSILKNKTLEHKNHKSINRTETVFNQTLQTKTSTPINSTWSWSTISRWAGYSLATAVVIVSALKIFSCRR